MCPARSGASDREKKTIMALEFTFTDEHDELRASSPKNTAAPA